MITKKKKGEMEKMQEGGRKLALVKRKLKDAIHVGGTAEEIEKLATLLIKKSGGSPSFKKVRGYSWATCVNVNDGIVHGIPKPSIVFKKGDIVSVDVGLFYKGFHTDTSFSLGIDLDKKKAKFLKVGEVALGKAIEQARAGNRIYDISKAIEETIEKAGYSPVKELVGHGLGKRLHEEPAIPCFVSEGRKQTPLIPEGATFAIEVMYTMGDPELVIEKDGWTIATRDGKISALFEETVAILADGPVVLTSK